MDLLNKIGQRNIAKYLIVCSCLISLIIYALKIKGYGVSDTVPSIMTIVLGTVIFSLSNVFLCIAAHKSRTHRIMAIFTSGIIVVLNALLFGLSLHSPNLSNFLFIVSLIEIIFSIIFLIFVIKSEKGKIKNKTVKFEASPNTKIS